MSLYLIHGALGAADQMRPMAAALRDSRRASIIELPGHGETRLGDAPFAFATFAEHIIATLDADGCAEADVFGYSMGGYAALVAALAQPGRVRRVMTLGTKFEWTSAVAERETGRLDPAKIRAKVPTFADVLDGRHRIEGGWETVLGNTASLMRELGERPLLGAAEFGRIVQPVCIGVGDRDATVTVEESARVARSFPGGSLAVLPGAPHALEQVDQHLLTAVMIPFFQA